MIVARCAMHLPIVRDLLNSSSTFCCRSLMIIFAAVPAIGRSPHNRETGQDTVFLRFMKGRFHVVALVTGDCAGLVSFINANLDSLRDPYEGEPLGTDWEGMIETQDAHQYGD